MISSWRIRIPRTLVRSTTDATPVRAPQQRPVPGRGGWGWWQRDAVLVIGDPVWLAIVRRLAVGDARVWWT
jgi:hypothetical protein